MIHELKLTSIDRWRDNILTKPDEVAFSFANSHETISNSQVYQFTVSLGSFMHKNDKGESQIVGIVHNQSPEAYLTQAALCLLGFAFVNLDPELPINRLVRIKEKLQLTTIFSSREFAAKFGHFGAKPFLQRQGDSHDISSGSSLPPKRDANLAYVVLTSGSSGEPKAVKISRTNLDHFVEWAQETFDLTSNDVFATLNPPHFDNAVFDFFCSQTVGAQLHVVPSSIVKNPGELATALLNSPCNVWFSVPSLMNYLLTTRCINEKVLRQFTKLLFGGEGLPKKLLQTLIGMLKNPKSRIWNVYGPSECACMCSAYELTHDTLTTFDGLAPIGLISDRFSHFLNDPDSRGVGELVLEGPQVGLGYVGDEMTTAKSFGSLDTTVGVGSSRTYRTGDLMRVDDGGRLRFVGRKDSQVKLMGRRIELTEIELEILRVDGCDEACVVLVEESARPAKLVAYVGGETGEAKVRESLAAALPRYMVPREIHVMSVLPKNRNGKIDRNLLRKSSRNV